MSSDEDLVAYPDRHEPPKAGGLRHNAGKLRLDLVPVEVSCMLGAVLGAAAESGHYPERNWEKGLTPAQLSGSLQRHLNKFLESPSSIDPQTGFPEYAMLLCNIAMVATLKDRERPRTSSSVEVWTDAQKAAVLRLKSYMDGQGLQQAG